MKVMVIPSVKGQLQGWHRWDTQREHMGTQEGRPETIGREQIGTKKEVAAEVIRGQIDLELP